MMESGDKYQSSEIGVIHSTARPFPQRVFDTFCTLTFLPAPKGLPVYTPDEEGLLTGRHIFRGKIDIETLNGIITVPASLVRDIRDLF